MNEGFRGLWRYRRGLLVIIVLGVVAGAGYLAQGRGRTAGDRASGEAVPGAVVGDDGVATGDAGDRPQNPGQDPNPERPFRVGLVTPGAADDLGYSQSMVDALGLVADRRGVDVTVTDGVVPNNEAAAVVRGFADDGYDLVIAHGAQFGPLVAEIAPDYPHVSFAWGTGDDTLDHHNVFTYTVRAEEGGYVLGTVAAHQSESGVIGVVGPIEAGDARAYVDGFVNGARAVRADVAVHVVYVGSIPDLYAATEVALTHVANGADVLTGVSPQVAGAVSVAVDEGIPWFGTQVDQRSLAPDLVVASQVYRWETVVDDIVDRVEAGQRGGVHYVLSLENGGLTIDHNPGFDLSRSIRAEADAAVADIEAGTIEIESLIGPDQAAGTGP